MVKGKRRQFNDPAKQLGAIQAREGWNGTNLKKILKTTPLPKVQAGQGWWRRGQVVYLGTDPGEPNGFAQIIAAKEKIEEEQRQARERAEAEERYKNSPEGWAEEWVRKNETS